MRIFDINNIELTNPDLSSGYLKEDRIFAKHHEAVEPVEEQWHYEIVAEYPNGGKDIRKVIDVVGVKAQEAWDEYEDIHRYIEYSKDELANMKNNNQEFSDSKKLDSIRNVLSDLINYLGLSDRFKLEK